MLITSFPEAEQSNQNNYTVLTHVIEIEGYYKEIVQLVYMLEQEEVLGIISSLKFQTYKDRVSKKRKLKVNIVLRNLES